MLRPDFFDLVSYAVDRAGRGQVLHQRDPAHARARPPARRPRLPRRADQHRRRHRGHQRRGARRGFVRRRPARHGQPRRGGLRPVQDQRRRHPPERRGARCAGRHRGRLRRPAAPDAAAPVGPRRRHLGRAAPDGGAAAHALPLAGRAPRRADRGLLLPPLRSGRAARRPQPVRGGPGGLPHRPRRRRLRLPVRDRPPVPRRQRPRARAASPPSGATSELFTSLREPQSAGACASCGSFDACRGGCMAAKFFTGLPLDGPDPECVHGHGEAALAASGRPAAVGPRALEGRPGRDPDPGADARPLPLAGAAPERVDLAGATWPQVEATGGRSVLAVPLGSLEQHGPHLPLDTDTRIAVRWRGGARRPLRRRRGGAGRRLRGQRRARRVPGHAGGRPRGAGRSPRRAGALRPRLVLRRRAGQRPRRERGGAVAGAGALRRRGGRRAWCGACAPPAGTRTPAGRRPR